MAIERLKSAANSKPTIRRTYRHDLESFFYVFVVGCIEYESVDEAKLRNLDKWCKGELILATRLNIRIFQILK
ncbi:Bgt-51303 [Blumeria graminis f. sp. tritici]|uniref:Bgt-51303 n=1 Tax=Blumeria graminis f. sp. tritici TaxID=62690 RepID=A0A9X9MQ35_BLUGR|nr:Bgt-51303 [Blumeria graminis f. sp. tritici]